MKLIRHGVASMILFAVLTGLCLNFYTDLQDSYGFTADDDLTINGKSGSVMYQLSSINIIAGIEDLQVAISQLKPASTNWDLVGGLASAGIGAVRVAFGLVSTPFEVVGVIVEYYTEIPDILIELVLLVTVYLAFLMLSAYLRHDV